MSTPAGLRSLFADRRMGLLSSMAAVGRFQDSMTILALLLGAGAAGLSLAEASLCTAALILAAGVASTPKARWIDRSGMRRAVGALSVASFFGYAILIAALFLGVFPLILASAALLGVSRTNSGMCMQVTWIEVVKSRDLRARAVSWESLVNTAMQNVGPILVGALVAVWSPMFALVFCGVATSLSMFLWSRSSVHRGFTPAPETERRSLNIGQGVMVVAGAGMCVNLLMGGLQVILVGGSSPAMAATLNAALALGAGAASLFSVARGFPLLSRLPGAVVLGIAALVAVLPLAGSLSAAFLLPALMVVGVVFGLSNSAITLMIQRRAPEGRRSEAFSWRLTLSFVGLSVGQALAGQLVSVLGLASAGLVFAFVGLALLACACLAMGVVRLPTLRRSRLAVA